MIKHSVILVKYFLLLVIASILGACAGGTVIVPITVQSDPLGGHVVYQLPSSAQGGSTDWIYLGKTPIDLQQQVDKNQLEKAQAFRIKVFKDGYNDQLRDWSEAEISSDVEEKGHVFWNPRLVPNGG